MVRVGKKNEIFLIFDDANEKSLVQKKTLPLLPEGPCQGSDLSR